MSSAGHPGVVRGNFPRTTKPAPEGERPADLVEREFEADASNQLWVADITYVRALAGWVYAAFVLDVFSHRIVGWQTSTRLYADLAIDALAMAPCSREAAGQGTSGLIHPSGRGVAVSIGPVCRAVGLFGGCRIGWFQRRLVRRCDGGSVELIVQS